MNPLLEDAIAMLREYGLAPEIENASRHTWVTFTNSRGSHCMLEISRTLGSRYAIRKSREQLRRLLRRALDDRP
jgi:hypothetical protein